MSLPVVEKLGLELLVALDVMSPVVPLDAGLGLSQLLQHDFVLLVDLLDFPLTRIEMQGRLLDQDYFSGLPLCDEHWLTGCLTDDLQLLPFIRHRTAQYY